MKNYSILIDKTPFDNGYINITHILSYRKKKVGKCGYIYGPTKTKTSKRSIRMIPKVRQAFEDILKMQDDKNLKCKVFIDGFDDFVILNKNGNPVHQRLFNLAIARILDKYNREAEEAAREKGEEFIHIPKFTCHSFRHTFATEFYATTRDIKSLQATLGHSDIGTTMDIYVDSKQDAMDAAIDEFAKIMGIHVNSKQEAIDAAFDKFAEKQNVK